MTCLSESVLLSILERRLSPLELADVDLHLDRCENCRALVAGLACDVSTPAPSDTSPNPPGKTTALSVGTVLADRYLVLEILGMGGMGVVYAAFDRQLDRKVAVKMMRGEHDGPERLIKEARNLARLTHPNVVVVHDVGEALGAAYMAMEYVKGCTLRRWVRDERPSPNRVLDVYLEAAKGLAAAHAAGLVHRDVKPDNILLGDDGRVRVMDFGLARTDHMVTAPPADGLASEAPVTSLDGTLPYIAPERFQGGVADARSDQFAFCVSLYEALYGEHPFEFAKLLELPQAMQQGRFRNPSRDRAVDRAVRAVLLRGLSADPAARFPSMDDLASALRGVGRRKRARTITALAAAILAMLGGAVMAVAPAAPPPPCAGSDRLLAGVWDPQRQAAIDKAILGTELVYAPNTSRSVRDTFDRYAKRWVATHAEACRATRVHGEQSEEVLDLRMACLGTRLAALRAMTDPLMQADKRAVEKAVEATQQLAAPELCDEVHVVAERLPPPDAATDVQVKALRERLARVEAQWHLGHETEALADATAITREAEGVRYPALHAEAGFWHGRLMNFRVDPAERERILLRALHAAERASQDRVAMEIWIELSRHALWATAHFDEAARAVDHAEAYATRVGDETVTVRLLVIRTGIHRAQGQNADALRVAQDAVKQCETSPRCVQIYLHRALVQLAIMRGLTGDVDGALTTFDRALNIAEGLLGADHPFLASVLNDRAGVLIRQNRYAEAVTALRRAVTIAERAGMGEGFSSFLLANLGETLYRTGAHEDAVAALQRSITTKERVLGPDHPELVEACAIEGDALAALKRGDEALVAYQRGLRIQAKSSAPGPQSMTLERAQRGLRACGAPCAGALKQLDTPAKEARP